MKQIGPGNDALESELRAALRGRVRFSAHERLLYATDASIYQVAPLGVVEPSDVEDVRRLLEICRLHGAAILPRGGGTSLAGQAVNRAVVCDLSPRFRSLLEFDPSNRLAHAQAGMSIDQVNRELATKPGGLFFAPDPATVAQCAIGGAIGNNAAGAHSIRYGRTSENIAALDVVLSDGEALRLAPGAGRADPRAHRLASGVAEIARRYADPIRRRFPKLNRRNAGYGIDLVLDQIDRGIADEDLDLTGLICGSEGSLAIVTSAVLKLHPIPRAKGLMLLSFPDLLAAIDSVNAILTTGAVAVELLDEEVLTAAAGNAVCREYLDLIEPIHGRIPGAVLYVEYQSELDDGAVDEGLAKLAALLPGVAAHDCSDARSMARAWALRKAGEPLLHGLSAHRKPLSFVEDNSIPVSRLPEFVRRFRQIVARHDTRAAYWAHASVGVLHIRPMLDLHDPRDLERMRLIAVEASDLARDCGGVMSGEHGDGRARGPLLERFFGDEIMRCFAEIKQLFDPAGILNPGMIVGAGPVESITQHLRVQPEDRPIQVGPVETYFDYHDQEGFAGAVEMCNGAGLCRKTAGGTMCPSYRATLDERHATRGRGNALRLAITGQLSGVLGQPDFNDPQTIQTLDLCLSCKACKSECPSNVDVARLKAEYTAQRYRMDPPSLATRVFGHVRLLNQAGSLMPGLANWIGRRRIVRRVMDRALNLAPSRSLPPFARPLRRRWVDDASPDRPVVALFGDCFVSYSEPHIGRSAARVLRALGYDVVLADAGCCGRSLISMGMLKDAIKQADRTLERLRRYIEDPRVVGIVVAEPSCLSAFKDDWLSLKLSMPIELRRRLAGKAFLIEEFIDRFWSGHPAAGAIVPALDGPPILLHGHCHQKALWGDRTSADLLRRLAGDRVSVLDSGCCGMAGSFGYVAHRYELSMRIGEQSLFGAIRAVGSDAIVIAPGTSCRHQIHDGVHRRALHPIEWIESLLVPHGQ